MKNIMKFAVLAIVAMGLAHSASAAAVGPVLSVSGSATLVNITDTVTLTLNISGLKVGDNVDLTGSPSVSAFDLVLNYDPTVLTLQSSTFGSKLWLSNTSDPTYADVQIDLSTPGRVELFDLSSDSAATLRSLQPASFSLGTVTFAAAGIGSTKLTWDAATSLSDETGAASVAFTSTDSATITSNVVPEPGTCGLVGLGLLGLLARGRRMLARA